MWAVLSGLLASRPLRAALSLLCVGFACYLWGYARGSATEALQGEILAHRAQTDFQRAAREAEEAARAEQGRIAREYEEQLRGLRHEQEELQSKLEGYQLVDAVRVPALPSESERVQCPVRVPARASGVSGGAKARGGLACYTEEQLRRKIAESVAIGQECDREMTRFRKLIEACHGR